MGTCREYQGPVNAHGYGCRQGAPEKRWGTRYVHRQVWIMANGPIPDGMVVMHSCDNRRCFLLDHLSLGTTADNTNDMWTKGRGHIRARLTHCKNGHEFTPESTYVHTIYGSQECRICRREASARHYAKSKAVV